MNYLSSHESEIKKQKQKSILNYNHRLRNYRSAYQFREKCDSNVRLGSNNCCIQPMQRKLNGKSKPNQLQISITKQDRTKCGEREK